MSAIGIEYNAKLQRIVREVKRDIDAAVIPLIRELAPGYVADGAIMTTDAWADRILSLFESLLARWSHPRVKARADQIASQFVQTALSKSERDIKKTAGIDVFSQNTKMQDYLRASAIQNAQLIKSIPAQYLNEVSTTVMANMRTGLRPEAIVGELRDRFKITEKRAKFIARDQTGKIQGDLAEKQQRAAGFEYFQWMDSDDQRVRDLHHEIANKVTAYGKGIYRWDDLPIGENGERLKPGQDFNCRCSSKPISARQVAENQRKGLVAEGVLR